MQAPSLTTEQRMEALERAKEVRAERARLRGQLARGYYTLADVFEKSDAGDNVASRTPIRSVLVALPGIGQLRADQILRECEISQNRRVRGVGSRQRERLVELTQKYQRA